jgi:hypothetical protein
LEAALGLVKMVYDKDGRNKISRAVLAQHLGHEAMTGPALGKIGALRAYGLIEGAGDDLRVSEDAIAAIMAPLGSDARRVAVRRLALHPTLFQDIRQEFPGKVSPESLNYWLIQNGFIQTAAPIASRTYLETMEFAGGIETAYDSAVQVSEKPMAPATDQVPSRPAPRFHGGGGGSGGALQGPTARYEHDARLVGDADAPFRITMNGKKLHIEADVDLAELQVLKQMLDGYENMLKILQKPVGQAKRPANMFVVGEKVPDEGIYNPTHVGHDDDVVVHLGEGTTFPPCETCGDNVTYRLAKKIIGD